MSDRDHGSHRATGSPYDSGLSRSVRLNRTLELLLSAAPELQAAAVVSFDGLAMASILPAGMDEGRVAAMSAALLSLGEKAAQGLGRGDLSQVYVEGEDGTVFLVSAEDEAVLVAVAERGAKTGLMLYEVRRGAAEVANILRAEQAPNLHQVDQPVDFATDTPALPHDTIPPVPAVGGPVLMAVPPPPSYLPGPAPWPSTDSSLASSLAPESPDGWS